MQQQTKKTYEIFGEPTTTIPKKGKNCEWKSNGKMINRSGHTFYFPIRFNLDLENKIRNGYTFVLIRFEKSVLHGTNVAYYYAYACIETGYVEIYTKHEVNEFVKCMNDIDKNIDTFIRLAYGSTKRVGNGQKATDKPLEEITDFNDYERYYKNFYWTNVEEDLYTHVAYGFYNDTTSYVGVTGIDKSTDIMTPTRLGQHNNNSNEKGYVIIKDNGHWTPCILMGFNGKVSQRYTFEEILTQANRLTDYKNINDMYTNNYKTERQIKTRLEELLTDYLSKVMKNVRLRLLPKNCEKLGIQILSYSQTTNDKGNRLWKVLYKLNCQDVREYVKLIMSLIKQFNLNYDKILKYYENLLIEESLLIEDEVITRYVKQVKTKDDSLHEEIKQQRLKEEEESKKPKKVDDLIQWDENEDLTNNDMEFLRITNKRFK
jgi:hypothetical protein